MRMEPIRHTAILASAGSGKTFALSHRYIALLARGVPPDRIVALTFTRKAAGEIFDSVVGRLCRAASSEGDAEATSKIIGLQLSRSRFLAIIASLLASLNRTRVGTLDSFFAGVLRSYADRFGIDPDFGLFESRGEEGDALHLRVLEGLLRGGVAERERTLLLSAIRQATSGREEKVLTRILDETLRECQETYRLAPGEELWGGEKALWGGRSPWLRSPGDVSAAAAEVIGEAGRERASGVISEGARSRWVRFAVEASEWKAGGTWTPGLKYLFEKLSPRLGDLESGTVEATVERRRYLIPTRLGSAAAVLVRHVVRTSLLAAMERTEGIRRLLARYEVEYDRRMRRDGRFSFSDAQHLLRPRDPKSLLSLVVGEGEGVNLEHRLDTPLDHWLLDEFQDTGEGQWSVMANLCDEVFRDRSRERSFFFVGDVKQAIYGWRGGNPRLFTDLLERYGPVLEEGTLEKSFRSCEAIIATVNRVFGDLEMEGFSPGALAYWNSLWKDHTVEPSVVPPAGYAAVLEPAACGEGERPTEEDRFRVVAAILAEIRPGGRDVSVGILVRRNVTGRLLTDFLRRSCPGESVVHEGTAAIIDNPATALLLSLVRLAHHPGDTFARRHLEMSPLRSSLESVPHRGRLHLPEALLGQIQGGGFARFVRDWGERLNRNAPLDAFGLRRLDDLWAAAVEFDRGRGGGGDEFLAFVERYGRKDAAAAGAVRVMTVHQAKGLDFDVVILPDLQLPVGSGGGAEGVVVSRDRETGRARWVLAMPRKVVARCDEVLRTELERREEERAFEELCVLYVALTRAREGLYMVTSHPGDSARSVTPATIIKQRLVPLGKSGEGAELSCGGQVLACLYEAGEREWHRRHPAAFHPPRTEEDGERAGGDVVLPLRRTLERVVPSARETGRFTASWLFDRASRETLLFGDAVHDILSRLEWLEDFDLAGELRRWQERYSPPEALRRKVREHLAGCLERKEVRCALERPAGRVELWREKRFETTIGDRWLSGVFDRVVIRMDGGGEVTEAVIIDFKSDAVGGRADIGRAVERYAPQMLLYRQALARMMGADEEKITLKLLFTAPGEVREVSGRFGGGGDAPRGKPREGKKDRGEAGR